MLKGEFKVEEIKKCYDFAGKMVDKHNPDMIMERQKWEIFRDDIRGKLGEIAALKYLQHKFQEDLDINQYIDWSISDRGQWDKHDIIINDTNISVKSVKGGSRVLMIECKRFDNDGRYIYENDKEDVHILVEVDISVPDADSRYNKSADTNKYDFDNINKYNSFNKFLKYSGKNRVFSFKILGAIEHKTFWANKIKMPKDMKLSYKILKKVLIDKVSPDQFKVENYYNYKKNEVLQKDNFAVHADKLHEICKCSMCGKIFLLDDSEGVKYCENCAAEELMKN